ncbi:biotin--[acetyl-CoA-carboxylase] ligase [Corticicoccus populi]|uniref:Bifunctional ligase/repressor BirA n=1 Tax=Corticicoccus populi TaxID=1812821 RepID=A0ABW5WSD6_9STAP
MSSLKTDILKLLSNHEHISGQKLADELEVSRTAVWKAVQNLKSEGYIIESVQNKGYLLKEKTSHINHSALLNMVEYSRHFDVLHFKESIDSTQLLAKSLINRTDEQFIVVALEQTAGRGRFNRPWASPKNNGLYISIVLKPDISLSEIIRFNLFMSLAISEALDQSFNIESGIKWPNDIYINDKKVCGFLTEVLSEDHHVTSIICGIGINLFDNDYLKSLGTATSIENESGKGNINIEHFLSTFISKIDEYYELFLSSSFDIIKKDWIERSIIFGKTIRITEMTRTYYGKPVDITDDGFLVVIDEEGETHKVISADIEL